MMRSNITACCCLALLACSEATACELAKVQEGKVHLITRKPVLGEDVRFISSFGMRRNPIVGTVSLHTGIDWSAPRGTSIIAAGAGRVVSAGVEGQYGKIIVIDHGRGLETAYAHLSDFNVRPGDCVAAGDKIGAAGSTGLASATGVHFEVRRNGAAVDPQREETTGSQ